MAFRDGDDAAPLTSIPHISRAEDSRDNGHALLPNPQGHIQRPFYQNRTIQDRFICSVSLILVILLGGFVFNGAYPTKTFKLGPHASILIESPDPWINAYVAVERDYGRTIEQKRMIRDMTDPATAYRDTTWTRPLDIVTKWSNSSMLFGFENKPALDVVTSWSENKKTTLHGYARRADWMYRLNTGSRIDISYNVSSSIPPHVYLVISAEFSSENNLLVVPINGTGHIGQDIPKSSKYFISLYNMILDDVEVEVQIKIKGLVYDHTKAFYHCTIDQGPCYLELPFNGANSAVLAFPNPNLVNGDDDGHVIVYSQPRWTTCLSAFGAFIIIMIATVKFLERPTVGGTRRTTEGESNSHENIVPHGAQLISQKDDNIASSHDTDDPEDGPSTSSHNRSVASDHEYVNSRRLCAMCFNAPRDCLFLPCGHCVYCYACGTTVAKVTGICSICKRHMKVKRIYTV